MTNKGWNMDKILGKTQIVCLIIMMIAIMVFGIAATVFGIQMNRDYDYVVEKMYEYVRENEVLKAELNSERAELAKIDEQLNNYIAETNKLAECKRENHTCLNVSEEYLMELLYNSKENVEIGETSELNNLIDELLGFVVVD